MTNLVDMSGSEITVSGGLFSVDIARQLRGNLGIHVAALTKSGQKLVQQGIVTKHGTGFTARNVQAYQSRSPSLYGKVRMDPAAVREPGTRRYPAKRRPFITAAVLEAGGYGGGVTRIVRFSSRGARARSKWQAGDRQRRVPLFMFRKAARILNARARLIRNDLLARGL